MLIFSTPLQDLCSSRSPRALMAASAFRRAIRPVSEMRPGRRSRRARRSLATSAPPAPAAVEAPARMTLAEQASFDAWLIKTYLGCWKPAPQPSDADLYVAQVRLAFNPDGSLASPPSSSTRLRTPLESRRPKA